MAAVQSANVEREPHSRHGATESNTRLLQVNPTFTHPAGRNLRARSDTPEAEVRVRVACCAAYRLVSRGPSRCHNRRQRPHLGCEPSRTPFSIFSISPEHLGISVVAAASMDLDIMPPDTPTSPHPHPPKRPRPSSPPHIKHSPTSGSAGPISPSAEHSHDGMGQGGAKSAQSSSSFRNVSACNRCRLRKNRCDQKLPSCASCEKARVACVGYDPITKREIPRRLVTKLGHPGSLCEKLTTPKLRLLPRDPGRSA